ncbi:FAD/NAD(P)-binding domain-containing protein [Artomyces pyxidatus]|uniref:FAD/NAD(P)-binding domain-containing protein n=1 Tax=Artomyces pyxidatus TaxID=48021 RepID=A0ACB8T030_9AGAM|nr:FAD/NAD(P)-binding domain-containing protein [Artomyces pyxidatus]
MMGRLARVALSLVTFNYAYLFLDQSSLHVDPPRKRIAIVGAGTAGVSVLKVLLADLPEDATQGWDVVLYEQRRDVGGIWLPDPNPPHPPELPETPLSDRLMTNTPHPTMTIPHFPFRPATALFPHHPHIQQYHTDIINNWNLSSHLRLNHEVLETRWNGDPESGRWIVKVKDLLRTEYLESEFDHLIIANGHNHYPSVPEIEGKDLWARSAANRSAWHSVFYRNPQPFTGKNVLVVGGGASSRDIAQQIVEFANSTYTSLKEQMKSPAPPFPDIPGTVMKPRIRRFTRDAIIFEDNTTLTHIDTVIFGTGYEQRIPFLTEGGHLGLLHDCPRGRQEHLTTNLRYVRPVYEHVLSLDASYPVGALYFIGLPIFVANAISDYAQALFTAHTIADPSLLLSRDEFFDELLSEEARLRADGMDPGYVGHRIIGRGGATGYQDRLVGYLQARGLAGQPNIPRGKNFTEPWRTFGEYQGEYLRRGWTRVEERGEEYVKEWLEGVETEQDWVVMMEKLVDWEKRQEEEEGTYDPNAYSGPGF